MKRLSLLTLLILFILTGCTTNYYLVVSDSEIPVNSTASSNDEIFKISPEKPFVVKGNKEKRRTTFGVYSGYSTYKSSWRLLAKLTKKQADGLTFSNEKGYAYNTSPNANYSGTKSTYSGGTVQVKGYTRKDGTYVRPHTRSAPRRN